MSHNPYASPVSSIAEAQVGPVAVFSPTQVACGSLIGGPVGLIYFLRQNFLALDKPKAAKVCLICGFILIVALVTIIVAALPARLPSSPFNLFYILAGWSIAQHFQMAKKAIAESSLYSFPSNWRVFGLALACMVGSAIAVIGPTVMIAMAVA